MKTRSSLLTAGMLALTVIPASVGAAGRSFDTPSGANPQPSPVARQDESQPHHNLRRPDWGTFTKLLPSASKGEPTAAKRPVLPPLPQGVEALEFGEFFKTPVGPRGLELTERVKALDGKRVRIFGYMVHEDLTPCNAGDCTLVTRHGHPIPSWLQATVTGEMLLTPTPNTISRAHYGQCDDLPPQTLFVTVPTKFGQLVPYTPGPMLLTGVLSVGNQREPDGRISIVRLALDPPPSAPALAQVSQPTQSTASQPANPKSNP